MFKFKKLAAVAAATVMALSTMSVCASAETSVANIVPITGASNYDANVGVNDSWVRVVGYINYSGNQVGTITGIYDDNVITDKVESMVSAVSSQYKRYAVVSSATTSASADVYTNAYSGKVNLSNSSARFGGTIFIT